MWMFTRTGFYSVNQATNAPELVMIRARARVDLERLMTLYGLDGAAIVATPDRDYPYRIILSKASLSRLLTRIGEDIDYQNFKAEIVCVHNRESQIRGRIYETVWHVLTDLETIDDLPMHDVLEESAV